MPTTIAMPIMKSKRLVISRVEDAATDEASAKITAKKNKTATAIPPSTTINFITSCFVMPEDLKLVPTFH